ncbi:hypothetical protein [Streptomyces sp. G45]|uniref:hypothetical protein n=1 Tax=Streptomyces sp. G45 TaxID=3406627 RepID=UPI003C1F7233
MAVSRLRTDATTRSRLGPAVIAGLKADLWAVDCQTCGGPLGRWSAPALDVGEEDGLATASLHHPRCRPPAWHDHLLDSPEGRARLTWRAGCARLPAVSALPVFLVNPSYECALLRKDGGGEWHTATLDPYLRLGLSLVSASLTLDALPALRATIDEDRISVEVVDGDSVTHAWHDVPLRDEVSSAVRGLGKVLVGVTTKLDVRGPFAEAALQRLMGERQVALGVAGLTSVRLPAHAQTLTEDDFDGKLRTEAIALGAAVLGQDDPPPEPVLAAALSLCRGDEELTRALSGRHKLAAVFLVSHLYGLTARSAANRPRLYGGVHIIAPDAHRAQEYADFFAEALARVDGPTLGRLGADPLSAEGAEAYLADVVIGTAREFRRALTAYHAHGERYLLHASRGHLALVVDHGEAGPGDPDLTRRYARVATV